MSDRVSAQTQKRADKHDVRTDKLRPAAFVCKQTERKLPEGDVKANHEEAKRLPTDTPQRWRRVGTRKHRQT